MSFLSLTGAIVTYLYWNFIAPEVIAGIPNTLLITAEVNFRETSRDVAGTNLWRLGMFGSKYDDGSGEKFNYVPQTLDAVEGSMSTVQASDLIFTEATAEFDIAAVGCNEFRYVCMEFAKGPAPTPDFTLNVVEEEITDKDVKTLCKRIRCMAGKKCRFSLWCTFGYTFASGRPGCFYYLACLTFRLLDL